MSTVLRFLGAARTVTGSKFAVETDRHRVLVDCGLFQGLRELRQRNWEPLPVPADAIDAVVLTHAHLDHCGYLPRLVREGFAGPVVASHGTAALAGIVLPDSAHLQVEEAEQANRYGYSRHHPALPLYDEADAAAALARLTPCEWDQVQSLTEDIHVELSRAGHILGSSIARLRVDGITVTFSGDLGRPSHPLLRPPEPVGDADWIVVESTYGDRRHDDAQALDLLGSAIRTTVERGGTVVIPAFAVDRTEVLLHHLGHLDDQGLLPKVPVYVDSPMALAALQVYRRAITERRTEMRPEVLADPTPFLDDRLVEVHDVESSKRLTASEEPKVIISASGMASGGRVVHHLARFLPDRKSSVVLVGFQAEGTRGRSLADGATELKMLGRYVRVRATVVDLPAFSVHADANELMAWLSTASREPTGVFVVHGEPAAAAALARRIEDDLDWTAVVPHHGERLRL